MEVEENVDDDFDMTEESTSQKGKPSTPKRKRRNRGELSKAEKEEDRRSKKIYQAAWESLPQFKGWLKPVKDDKYKGFCCACKVAVLCCKSDLEKHASGTKHLKNLKGIQGTATIETSFAKVSASASSKLNTDTKKAEISLSAVFAEHNISIHTVDHLVPVLKTILSESPIAQNMSLGRTKCAEIIKTVVAKVESDEVVDNIKKVPFAVIIDGSTDISVHKNLCVLVRYISPKTGLIRTDLLELIELDAKDCSAAAQYAAFKKCLQDKDIPLKNIAAFGCDNENTMTGEHNSFWSRLREDVPHCILIGCNCHSAATSASHAGSQLPPNLDELMCRVSSYIGRSAKRLAILEEFQEFFEAEAHKILKLCKTRWLCRHACVCRMIEQWSVLENTFAAEEAEQNSNRKPASEILEQLTDSCTKAYFLFLQYSLLFFNKYNAMLQSDKIMIHKLKKLSIQLLQEICQNYMKPAALESITTVQLDDPQHFLPIEKVFLGPGCEEYLQTLPDEYKSEIATLRVNCQQFFIKAALNVKSRSPSLTDSLFEELKFVDPQSALFSNSQLRQKVPQLQLVTSRYKSLLDLDTTALALEWRSMPYTVEDADKERICKLEPDEAWNEIAKLKTYDNQECFPQLTKLARCAMSTPHGSSDAERIFAVVTDVRTKKRNRIGSECMNAVCITRSCFRSKGIDCTSFSVAEKHLALHNQSMYSHITKAGK